MSTRTLLRRGLLVPALLFVAAVQTGCATSDPMATTSVLSAAGQKALTPDEVRAEFEAGNARFVAGKGTNFDWMSQVRQTASGQYPKAIAQINMALKQEPQNGLYYYGRGRVYLLWGDKAKAMDDFKKAAELGDEDALNYLEYIGEGK